MNYILSLFGHLLIVSNQPTGNYTDCYPVNKLFTVISKSSQVLKFPFFLHPHHPPKLSCPTKKRTPVYLLDLDLIIKVYNRRHYTCIEYIHVDVDVWYGSRLRFISTGLRLGIWSAIRVFKSLIVVRHSPEAFCSKTFVESLEYVISTL